MINISNLHIDYPIIRLGSEVSTTQGWQGHVSSQKVKIYLPEITLKLKIILRSNKPTAGRPKALNFLFEKIMQ